MTNYIDVNATFGKVPLFVYDLYINIKVNYNL